MSDNPLIDNPFFLTRQIANLMEDFARETSRSSSIFYFMAIPRLVKAVYWTSREVDILVE